MKKCFVLILVWLGCSSQAEKTVLNPLEFQKKLTGTPEAVLVDVRTIAEVEAGTIENSVNVVYDDTFETKLSNLARKTIFVYCASGKRSAKAATLLRAKGYKEVYELEGGLNAWKTEGLPVVIPKK